MLLYLEFQLVRLGSDAQLHFSCVLALSEKKRVLLELGLLLLLLRSRNQELLQGVLTLILLLLFMELSNIREHQALLRILQIVVHVHRLNILSLHWINRHIVRHLSHIELLVTTIHPQHGVVSVIIYMTQVGFKLSQHSVICILIFLL